MPFPLKFKKLIQTKKRDVVHPDLVSIHYAVCAIETNSCGWQGWALGAVGLQPPATSHTLGDGRQLEADNRDRCPQCGRHLVVTGVWMLLEPSARQSEFEWRGRVSRGRVEYVDDTETLLVAEYAGIDLQERYWGDSQDHEHCEVCGDPISSMPYEHQRYYGDGAYKVCPPCYGRITRARESMPPS